MKSDIEFDQNGLINSIKKIILDARKFVASNINHELIAAYWNIGKVISDHEKVNGIDAISSGQTILEFTVVR